MAHARRNNLGIDRADYVEQTPLERWRVERGLSVQELARRVGISPSTMTCWCRGSVVPSVPSALRIQDVTEGEVPVVAWLATKLGREQYLLLEGKAEAR
jgi:transcriptional regulator with XRE-family HTH domain